MTTSQKTTSCGFTLLELTLAMMMGMAIGGMILTLFQLQISFLREYRRQSFLSEEAPVISMFVSKIVGKADSFSLHDSEDDALRGRNPQLTSSDWMRLNFRQPDGALRTSILAFEDTALNYYVLPSPPPNSLEDPEWSVSDKAQDVDFTIEQGVLRMALTGPEDEQITYSGTMQK